MPEFLPKTDDVKRDEGLVGDLRYLADAPRTVRRDLELSDAADEDLETDTWRVRGRRRLQLVLVVALTGLLMPVAAVVIPMWIATLPWPSPVAGIFLIGVLGLIAVLVGRFVRLAVRYGNGGDGSLGRILGPAGGIGILLVLLGSWSTFR